jgi:capsular polysaccharide biosynthesis protein
MRPDVPALGHEAFREVSLLPVARVPGRGHVFGAAGPDGRFIEAFAHRWCRPASARLAAPPRRLDGQVAYGGLAMSHFGHFLLEALSRLWFLRDRPELPVVWHWIDLPVAHTPWQGWMEQVLHLAGLGGHRHVILRQPMVAAEILVPAPGFVPHRALHPDQARALAVVAGDAGAPGGRVWLSRRHLPPQFGRIEGEGALEALLTARGWTVLRPETLPVGQQAGIFAAAEVVSGFAGSALHAVLLQQAPRARMRPVLRPAVPMRDYDIIAAARGLDHAAIAAPLAALDARGSWTSYRIEEVAALAAAVDAA